MQPFCQSFRSQMSSFYFILLGLSFCFRNPSSSVAIYHEIPHRNLADSFCPLSFRVLRKVFDSSKLAFLDVPTKCVTILQGIRLVRSNYLRITGNFFPHPNSSEDCWDGYQKLVDESIPGFNIRSTCGYNTGLISESCKNITTGYQFEGLISDSKLQEVRLLCNRSLDDDSSCIPCQASLSSIYQSYFHGTDIDNASDCSGYPFIYAGALANQYGPTASGTAKCLFSLDLTSSNATSRNQRTILCAVTVGAGFGLFMTAVVVWFIWRRRKKWKRRQNNVAPIETGSGFGIETISGDSTLVKFTFEEIKRATKNFSRENIVGKGGYGNVYKGILEDGSEVALKRFKNCSAAGDATFAREVEVIASISHVNLVAFRGYCTATVPMEGHQRIIVCDLVHNGSLYDHLFGSGVKKLSWPIRQKIAIGVARGLAYLHYGAQPVIIHRDVKASNILLDDTFEPKLADFGLAKFIPDGLSHMSTRAAGTLGYVAPEYALYGQLTERSDVYGFGVVLLELLSGKKAVISIDDHHTLLLTDWAWSLVEEGRVFDVIDENMPELGPPEVMERYVLVAVLSSHSQLYARPTMDQIVRILESDFPLHSIPKLPFSLPTDTDDGEKSANFSQLDSMSSTSAEQPCDCKSDQPILDHREIERSFTFKTCNVDNLTF
ncbi:Receptor-like kinase in in flowers 3, putative [Theobroma cacao]|uniref:non-specific serine/threonine protein kinase n=1 Tax=Theobroma cacao TaxID=3641 RepID=A0A061F2J8_THECC|nr:Receptor-like kinase in in flowers 3, putative [Theobroma cacao]